jgi:hypothetical protein
MAETFVERWRERLELPAKGAWKQKLRGRLEAVPFSESKRTFELFDFLLSDLPKRVKQRRASLYQDCADAYGWFCCAVLFGESIYVQYAENYAFYLKEVLESDEAIPYEAAALAEIYRPTKVNGVSCGFNRLIPGDPNTLHAEEEAMARGQYEDFLTASGKQKFQEYTDRLQKSDAFGKELVLLQTAFPKKMAEPIVRRSLLLERNWQTGEGASFTGGDAAFQAVFDLFCWKWYLWGVAGNEPLLLKPSVNVTAYGTQLFIPGYLSLDAKRDIAFKRINRLHRARGNVKKQGAAFTESREQFDALSKQAREAERAGRKQGLKGDALMDYVLEQIGRPWADPRQLRRWLGETI